jgi:hypothetical protein
VNGWGGFATRRSKLLPRHGVPAQVYYWRAQLLLQVLDLRLQGVEVAGHLATKCVELGGIAATCAAAGRLSCSLLRTTISCSRRSIAALGLPCFFSAVISAPRLFS